jgi:UDP-N-acetylglucosamine--N-acetylmuramyl-(pentapeptide) pyrophosphoryl-undecaprenol N-acetylglucosamine transferase
MAKRVLITGGGTGGHVYPAIATVEALKQKGEFDFIFVGGKSGIETKIIPQYGIPMRTILISGFQRYLTWKNFLFPFKLIMAIIQSYKIVRSFKPDVAIGTGGYVSGPVLYIASKLGVPVLIQEQDVYPGITTRLLIKYAKKICIAYDATKEHFQKYLQKVVVTGNPVCINVGSISRKTALSFWNFVEDKPVIFVFGGSQGARSINQAMMATLPRVQSSVPIQVLWQTGTKEYQTVRSKIHNEDDKIKILPYINEMAEAYVAADIIICRAGAITLAELALAEKAVILIPYPYAAGNHQVQNARTIEQNGAAIVVTEDPGWHENLYHSLMKLLNDQRLCESLGNNWTKIARPNASEEIADEVIALLENK